MQSTKPLPATYRQSMRKLFWLPVAASAIVVMLVLAGMLTVSWRSLERLKPIESHLVHIERIQDIALSLEQTLMQGLRGVQVTPDELDMLRKQIGAIAGMEGTLHPDTRERLQSIADRLGDSRRDPVDVLFQTLAEIRKVLEGERERHDWLLEQVTHDTRTEVQLTAVLMLVVPLLIGAFLLMLQRRVRQPLSALEALLSRLAERDYRPVPAEMLLDTDRIAHPAFRSYNELVSRLRELESEHHDREQTLEQEVRRATEALLAQSRELARAERLAAVGAVSAGLAHELRNPLAGIQMACTNLHRALGDSEHARRIAAVIDELKRINHLLTTQVDAARHLPEPLETVELAVLIGELITLVRYQVPSGIRIDAAVPDGLRCLLPPAGLRQALLNLILNAVQVLGEAGSVRLSVDTRPGEVVIGVCDTGPGFPHELLRTGIRPFATGRQGGTGLGLAMVRRFVRDHDGDLTLSNQQPHGACVTLSLPRRPADASGDPSSV